MAKKNAAGSSILDRTDDAPELTEAFFAAATLYDGDKVVRRGRPKLDEPKQLVSIRFPAETLRRLRATGPGWQGLVVQAVEQRLGPAAHKKEDLNPAGPGTHSTPARRRRVTGPSRPSNVRA